MAKKNKQMGSYYQRVTVNVNVVTWSYETGDNTYSKRITEDDSGYLVEVNPDGEAEIDGAEGVIELTHGEWNDYFDRIGSHPAQKPK